MFSSGFFLLPGLAAAQTGPAVALAYLVAGLFILPAMLSVAELATAMPRAGGAYYFLDRALGPLVGTVGGLGSWFALVLKSAFALVGMGAYLAIYVDVPVEPLAVALTLVFLGVNVVGARETSGLQRALVVILIGILALFLVQGLAEVLSRDVVAIGRERFTPFLPFGLAGFMATVGLVFVSYAGLTKVASVAEEVRNPDRNIPLGMMLSLATATLVYSVGVYVIVAVLPLSELQRDLTPVATAAAVLFDWIPGGIGVGLIVVAAVAAFASTGNAGILSASRYPLAMARDHLVPSRFRRLGRFHTPTFSITATSLLVIAAILLLDVASLAKLASAFQLLLFAMLNLAVVVMRESRIEGYDPGFRSPLYPWLQLLGIVTPFLLIAEMGQMAMLFSIGLVGATLGWYFYYVRPRVARAGAIFHTFARLGGLRDRALDLELRSIAQERGLRDQDPFEEVVARAPVLELHVAAPLEELARVAASMLATRSGVPAQTIAEGFPCGVDAGFLPLAHGAALPHVRVRGLERPMMVLMRCHQGLQPSRSQSEELRLGLPEVRALVFLASPEGDPGRHLRLLGHLATHVSDPGFLSRWLAAGDEAELKETLLRAERRLTLRVGESPGTERWAGRSVETLALPRGALVALIRRQGRGIFPDGATVLEKGDRLTVLGEPDALRNLTRAARHPLPSRPTPASRRVDPSTTNHRPMSKPMVGPK